MADDASKLGIPGASERRGAHGLGHAAVSKRASSVNFLTAIPVVNPIPVNDNVNEKHKQMLLKKYRQSLNKPVGILSVHVKHVNFVNLNSTGVIALMNPELNVYLRLLVGKQIKCTCEYEGVIAPAKVIMDELKHFNMQVSTNRSDMSNYMRMEVIAYEKENPNTHLILAMKELHLYEIIKRLYTVETMELYKSDKFVAEVDLEFCFSYGVFGYGYANQFENRQKSLKEQVQHSMFCREEPPYDRLDGYRNIMLPRPVGHPSFIYFSKKVEIGDTANKYKSEMSVHEWQTVEEPVLLVSRMRRKMHKLYQGYSDQPNRKARLEYLRNMVMGHVPQSNVNEGVIQVSEKFKLRRRQHKSLKTRPVEEPDAEDKLVYAREDLEVITKVMQQAPGIIGRDRNIPEMSKIVEDAETEPEQPRRGSVVKMIGNSLSRVFAGMWKANTDRQVSQSTESIGEDKSVTAEAPRDTLATVDPAVALTGGVVPRRRSTLHSKRQQVVPILETNEDGPGEPEVTVPTPREQNATFGRRLLDTSTVMAPRRPSTGQKGQSQARRPSILESAATRLRGILNQDMAEQKEQFDIPRVMVTPCTPLISSESESEED